MALMMVTLAAVALVTIAALSLFRLATGRRDLSGRHSSFAQNHPRKLAQTWPR